MFYTCRPCFNQRVDLRHFFVDSLQFCNNVAESLLMNGLFRICDILWVVDKRLLFEDVGLQKRQKLFLSVISRPYGTIQSHLCYSVASVCLWRYVLWLNGASYSYWQPIVVYEKSIGTKTNNLDLCLEVVSKSCQPLRYIRRWIARKPLRIEAWFGSKGPPIGNGIWGIKWSRDRWRHSTPKGAVRQYGRYPSDSLASCFILGTLREPGVSKMPL